jgi:glycosyltransferase involved in cell wall biosynthesis
MKLCFECSEYPPALHGGIGTLVQTLARGFVKAGHEVRVVGLYPASSSAPDFEEDCGVKVWRLRIPPNRCGWLLARRRLFALVQRWARSGDIELIDVPDFGAPVAGWPTLPIPVVVRLSGTASYFLSEMGRRSQWFTYKMDRASIRRGNFVCSTSRYVGMRTKALFGLPSDPDAVIYNPVDVPDPVPHSERDRNMVVFSGILAAKKGVISLVRCWPDVKKSCPEATLHIWGRDGKAEGGGSMRQFLDSLLPAAPKDSVYFHGQVPLEQLLAVLQTAAMAVLPSYAEAFALMPLHAMAARCPTIYTTRGSGPELIDHGYNGLLIDPDRPDEIARAIVALVNDRSLANRLGENGRRRVEQAFSWQVLRAQNEEFYLRCLEQFRKSGRKNSISAAESIVSGPEVVRQDMQRVPIHKQGRAGPSPAQLRSRTGGLPCD